MRALVGALLVLSTGFGCGGAPAPEPAPAPAGTPETPPAAAPAGLPIPPSPQAPAGATVGFLSPKDGDTVRSPVRIVMGASGVEVRAAGEMAPGTGHHHVIVDAAGIPNDQAVPKDEQHIHFGKGQTEAEVALAPGPHTLTLQFADGNHVSYGEPLAATIRITVE